MKVKFICGPPGSGKTTYVDKHRGENDLIYDYDKIMQALSGYVYWRMNWNIHPYIQDFYTRLLTQLRYDKNLNTAWIIKTIPDRQSKNLLKNCDVEYLLIDTPFEVCRDRIIEDPLRTNEAKALNALDLVFQLRRDGVFDECKKVGVK